MLLEPEVRDAIAREVVLTLKDVLPDLLSETLKKSKEEEEKNHENKVYDSDGDEVTVGLNTCRCTYKGFKDGDPPMFDGNKDLVAMFEWIERMNGVINLTRRLRSRMEYKLIREEIERDNEAESSKGRNEEFQVFAVREDQKRKFRGTRGLQIRAPTILALAVQEGLADSFTVRERWNFRKTLDFQIK
ncbi:hypothetical protein L1987_17407 [Smallanthus sonchifolius]|uniref:Uncharacterized protein n=1 Tax=Smallanthus sonchifolius TaxID=185202 RepID=A0ACB9IYU2_9ASTR|nr:hypothetical protein L1987_17407 [Smallanthus sonchifolius]